LHGTNTEGLWTLDIGIVLGSNQTAVMLLIVEEVYTEEVHIHSQQKLSQAEEGTY
jgi:hypothetical protein